MRVGDVYLVELPTRGGRAQTGRRPAVILQATTSLPTTLVIPLTSQLDALRFEGTVLVETDSTNGLNQDSVALVFQTTAIDRRYVLDHLGNVSDAVLGNIFAALDELMGRR